MIEVDPVALVVAFIFFAGAISGVWLKLTSNRRALDEYRIHVAEHYVTKAGMHEQTDQIMRAIRDVDTAVEQLNQRIDRVIEQRSATT